MAIVNHVPTKLGLLRIRPAVENDTDQVYSVLKNIADWLDEQKYGQWIPGGHDNNIDFVAQTLRKGMCYILEHNEKIVATVQLGWTLPDYWTQVLSSIGYISTLYIHRDLARLDIGASLLRWSEDQIRLQKKDFACLDCYAQNLKLCAYYEKSGYESIDQVETYPGYTQRLYQKYIGQP